VFLLAKLQNCNSILVNFETKILMTFILLQLQQIIKQQQQNYKKMKQNT